MKDDQDCTDQKRDRYLGRDRKSLLVRYSRGDGEVSRRLQDEKVKRVKD